MKNNKPDFNKAYYTTDNYSDYLQRFMKEGEEYAQRMIEKLSAKKSWKFLDVGCGMGGVVMVLRNLGYQAWGIEVSPFCLENSPAARWLSSGDVRKLPYKNKTFDVVLAIDMLYYLPPQEQEKGLKELSRITKRFLYFETTLKNSHDGCQATNYDANRDDNFLLTKEENLKMIRRAGLKIKVQPFTTEEMPNFNYILEKI